MMRALVVASRIRCLAVRALALALAVRACRGTSEVPDRPAPATIRVAVVGGIVETGLWAAVAERYERLTGHTVELAASGPKPQVVAAFRRGGIELITVHASDAMVNLVADGLARDPQPWLRNDFVIVGRIPFVMKKLAAPGIERMVQGDPRLRRPYLVEVSTTAGEAARDLAAFLRGREVQELLATFGKGKYDDRPLFFPVVVPP